MRFGGCDLGCGSAEENADRERDDATDENKPGPRNFGPPLGHEPAEIPFSSQQLSSEERQNVERRNRDFAQDEHGGDANNHGHHIHAVAPAAAR